MNFKTWKRDGFLYSLFLMARALMLGIMVKLGKVTVYSSIWKEAICF